MTYSFPCQDLSVAGKMRGMTKGSNTRSGLLWEVERLLNECNELPQILLMENVPQVISEDNKKDFELWTDFLVSKGYFNTYKILNAVNFDIPQNRERCFMVSVPKEYYFEFPSGKRTNKTISDLLEIEVDEKYYLKGEKVDKLISELKDKLHSNIHGCDLTFSGSKINRYDADISKHKMEHTGVIVKGFIDKGTGIHQSNTVYDSDGVSPALNACDYKSPIKIIERLSNDYI